MDGMVMLFQLIKMNQVEVKRLALIHVQKPTVFFSGGIIEPAHERM